MSHALEDYEDTEIRDQFGNPPLSKIGAERSGPITATVDQSVNKNELLPWIATCCLLTGVSIAIAIWVMIESSRTERETRMLEYYILELDGKLMNQGLIDPSRSLSSKRQQKETEK